MKVPGIVVNAETSSGAVLVTSNLRICSVVPPGPCATTISSAMPSPVVSTAATSTGELIGAYGLADELGAKLVRRENGLPAVTDGPYLETKEYIASFYLLDVESEERALQIAADMPWADVEPVEFWPILHEAKPDL